MEWIHAVWRSCLAALSLSVLLLNSSHLLAYTLECPAALSTGQPACEVSRDPGSNAPDSAHTKHLGNPIDVVSGNKYQSEVDVQLGNSHLSLVRHYNSSRAGQNIGLGNGWRHTYSVMLSTDGDDVRHIMQSDGRMITFRKNGDRYLATDETDGHVIESSEHKHIWHLPDGRNLTFFGSFLTGISFADGGNLNLFYRGSRLFSVSDDLGRSLVFHYTPGEVGLPAYDPPEYPPAPGHLVNVSLPDGKKVSFGYSGGQNLVSVDYPRGTQGNLGRRYRYQDSLNRALLTERTDARGKVFARWRYDELGRAVTYRGGSSIRADGSESGPPNVALEYSAGVASGHGITRVVFGNGSTRVYEWKVDESGQVVELDNNSLESSATAESGSNGQPIQQTDANTYVQYYPQDVLTVLAVDPLGYPSRIQHSLARDGSTHILESVYDQTGRLVDVNWLSGVLEDYKKGQTTTIAELRKYVAKHRATRTNLEVMFSALAQKAFIQGTVSEFLEQTDKELSVGSTITGEELDEVRRTASLYGYGDSVRPGYKADGESEDDTPCMDPLRDCATLLRTQDYAEVAECAYADALCSTRFVEADLDALGIELADLHDGSFRAEIYQDAQSDEYIVSFAGTDFTSGGDWLSNIEQEMGRLAFQYEKAVRLARLILATIPTDQIRFVGHSLGGGLATAAAGVGGEAIVFNPAALTPDSANELLIDYEISANSTMIYSVDGELLSNVQTGFGFTSEPPGTMNILRRPNFSWIQENVSQNSLSFYETRLGVTLHGMDAVQQSLMDLIERNQCV